MNTMKRYVCSCGGKIVFETKKTFTNPEEKNGVCLLCKKQYKLVNCKIIEKGEKNAIK